MTLKRPDSRLARLLVGYYGLIELAHIVALAWAAIGLARTGDLGFPAAPPPGGWSSQAVPFLVATGVLDAINVVIAWRFVLGYFTEAPWRWWVGGITLTATVYSAVVFAWGTLPSGAWAHNPGAYLPMVVVFIPVAVLVIAYVIWGTSGAFDEPATSAGDSV